jgi:hypothetical protein
MDSPFARQSTLREHLNSIKLQISDLTRELEHKVSSGYFDILCSAQNLADLSSRLSDLPDLHPPPPPHLVVECNRSSSLPKSPLEPIWGLIETGSLRVATEELLKGPSNDESVELIDYILQHFKQTLPAADGQLTEEIMLTLKLIAETGLLEGENPAVRFYFDALACSFSKVPREAEAISHSLQTLQRTKLIYESCVEAFCTGEVLSFEESLATSKQHLLGIAGDLLESCPTPTTILTLHSIKHTELWGDFKPRWLSVASSTITTALDSMDWPSVCSAPHLAAVLKGHWSALEPTLQILQTECAETYSRSLATLRGKLLNDLQELAASATSDNLLAWYVGVSSQKAFESDLSFLSQLWIEAVASQEFIEVLRQIRRVCGELTHLAPSGLKAKVSSAQLAFAQVLKVEPCSTALYAELDEAPETAPVGGLSLPPRFFPHLVLN